MSVVLWSQPKIWLLVFVALMHLHSTASPPRIPMHCDNPLRPHYQLNGEEGKKLLALCQTFSSSLFKVLLLDKEL